MNGKFKVLTILGSPHDKKSNTRAFVEDFVEEMQCKLPDGISTQGIPKVQLSAVKKTLDWYRQKFNNRDEVIVMAYKSGHYTQVDIGEYFGISHTTVSRVIKQTDVQMET